MSIKRYAFTVHGTVQGVFFRKFTQQSANEHSISGFVRNLPDGSVGGEAEGLTDNLAEFKKKLDTGSRYSHVQKVDWQEMEIRKQGEGQGYMMATSSDNFSIAKSR
ncbi:Acylphosphatase [Dactylellina cionopaga]|nr:Acylphosphatase [Dactylellina cionopaga]